MDRERKPLTIPTSLFEGETGQRIADKINNVFELLGVVGEDPDLDTLTDASIVLELAVSVLLARYSFGIDHFTQGIAMVIGHIAGDAQHIMAENTVKA